ncbi:hypothetical protein Tco_0168055 [Tanacetum coccineum]
MDSIIQLGQENTLAEYMILSVEHGPLIWPTIEENGVTRTKKYVELSAAKKIQVDYDMKATNIILQGLPANIYSLKRECKLYDAFDKFTHIKEELLHKYCLRFTQTINDINIYKMKMEQFQVNTKFLNSLPREWSKFMTDVKLVKDLHTTNFDQLHAYLEQHELYSNESSYNNPHLQQQFPPSQYGSIHPTQHYSSTYPSQPQFNHSSVPPSYPYQSQMNHQTSFVPQIDYQSPQGSTQPMTESPLVHLGLAVLVFSLRDDPIACLNKAMDFLTVVAFSRGDKGKVILVLVIRVMLLVLGGNNVSGQTRVVKCYNCQGSWTNLDEEQLAFLIDAGVPNGQTVQTIIPNNAAFQTEDLDSYDSDCDDVSNAKSVLMANISNYGYDIISEDFEQTPVVDVTDNEITSDSNIISYS